MIVGTGIDIAEVPRIREAIERHGQRATQQHGRSFNRVTLPIGQMYHVAVDNDVPYKIYGNMQDDGTMRGPSIRDLAM